VRSSSSGAAGAAAVAALLLLLGGVGVLGLGHSGSGKVNKDPAIGSRWR
jgi:hypothetical protein